jgi:hypothetical protein
MHTCVYIVLISILKILYQQLQLLPTINRQTSPKMCNLTDQSDMALLALSGEFLFMQQQKREKKKKLLKSAPLDFLIQQQFVTFVCIYTVDSGAAYVSVRDEKGC